MKNESQLFDKLTAVLGYTTVGDESEQDNLDYLIQKYIYGLRQLELDASKEDQKTVANNLNKINEFFSLYDKLQTSVVQRTVSLENTKVNKLDALNRVRTIRAVVVDSSVEEATEELAGELLDKPKDDGDE